jgi:multidrug efflux pump subunit AcrB
MLLTALWEEITMITSKIVTQTWQRMSQASVERAPKLVEQMKDEQPVVLSFLLHLDDLPFNQYEQELLFYIGLVVWQIMKQSEQQLYKVTGKKLRKAEELNVEILERLASSGESEFMESAQLLIRTHAEPEVLRYIVEAIMEEAEEEPGFQEANKGLAFIHLKILLDAFVNSLRPRPRLVA